MGQPRGPHLPNVTFAAPEVCAPSVRLGPASPPASADLWNGPSGPRAKGQTGQTGDKM